MTIQNKRIFASILFVLISFVCAYAQVTPPAPPPPAPPPPPGFPIDGGVLFCAFAALFYGAKKMVKK